MFVVCLTRHYFSSSVCLFLSSASLHILWKSPNKVCHLSASDVTRLLIRRSLHKALDRRHLTISKVGKARWSWLCHVNIFPFLRLQDLFLLYLMVLKTNGRTSFLTFFYKFVPRIKNLSILNRLDTTTQSDEISNTSWLFSYARQKVWHF